MSIEVAQGIQDRSPLLERADDIIKAWSVACRYYQDAKERYGKVSERYKTLANSYYAYSLTDPIEKAGDFFLDHARMLKEVAEEHFGVGGVKLDIDLKDFREVLNCRKNQSSSSDLKVEDEVAIKQDLEDLWKEFLKKYSSSTVAKEEVSTQIADEIVRSISGMFIRTHDRDGKTSLSQRVEMIEKGLTVTKKYTSFKFSAGTSMKRMYNEDPYVFDFGSIRSLVKHLSNIADWMTLANHLTEKDAIIEAVELIKNEPHFSYGQKLIEKGNVCIIARKSVLEIQVPINIGSDLVNFIIGWATHMKDAK